MFALTAVLFPRNCSLRHFQVLFPLRSRTSSIMLGLCCTRDQFALMQFFCHLQQYQMCCITKQTPPILLSELENSSDLFSQKEKPYRDCMFQVGGNEEMQKCDLFWKKSQVALFTSDNEECYAAAKNSDIRCIYCADDTVTVRKILDVLKEQ